MYLNKCIALGSICSGRRRITLTHTSHSEGPLSEMQSWQKSACTWTVSSGRCCVGGEEKDPVILVDQHQSDHSHIQPAITIDFLLSFK